MYNTSEEQEQLINTQDILLEVINRQINVIKHNAYDLSDVLDQQNEKLDSFAINVENTTNRINSGTKNIDKFRRKISSNWFCIAFLILIVIIVCLSLLLVF